MLVFVCVVQHLLFSVTDPQFRAKPAGVSDVSSYYFLPTEQHPSWLVVSFSFVMPVANCGE